MSGDYLHPFRQFEGNITNFHLLAPHCTEKVLKNTETGRLEGKLSG